MSAEPEYTTHTRVTVSIPHEDAMKLVRAGVGQTDERQWAGNHSTADILDVLGAVPIADMAREIGEAERGADEWKARAEKAEATVAAVREHVEDDHIWWPKSAQREGLRKILDPKPAFTLPTEAGARFEATHKGTGTRNEFVTFTDGSNAVYVLHEGTYWVAEDVMNGFEGFRLLGADQ